MLGIGIAEGIEDVVVRLHAAEEARPVLLPVFEPCDFGECEHARQELVFKFDAIISGLCPQIALHAEAVVFASAK